MKHPQIWKTTNPSVFVFEWCKHLLKRRSFCIWYKESYFTPFKRNTLGCINKLKLFWFIWMSSPSKAVYFDHRTKWKMFIFWKQNTRFDKKERFLLSKLLFLFKLLDKSLRNRFYMCCFEFVLSKVFTNINNVLDNNNCQ